MTSPPQQTSPPATDHSAPEFAGASFVTGCAAALLVAGLAGIPEEAAFGGGLLVACGWLLLAAVSAWLSRPPLSTIATVLQTLLIVTAAGIGISCIDVFLEPGDRRAGLNLTLEWSAVPAAAFVLLKLRDNKAARSGLLLIIAGMAAGQAAYGIWQHAVFYPGESAWYLDRQQQIEIGGLQAADAIRELESRGIPTEGASKILFENRLLNSTEPLGTYALANTLAGVLTALIFVMIAACRTSLRQRRMVQAALWGAGTAVVLYCLILTKSRSAWAAAFAVIAGRIILALLSRRKTSADSAARNSQPRSLRTWCYGGCAGLLFLGAVGAAISRLDREVILESPRSLQFRLMYWAGAVNVIQEAPWVGSGPANFRSAYLRHRLPDASEEIIDPHNLLLDAWCSGGLPAALAMLGIILVAVALWAQPLPQEPEKAYRRRRRLPRRHLIGGVLAGLGLWAIGEWIFLRDPAEHFPAIGLCFLPVAGLALTRSAFGDSLLSRDVRLACAAGAIALLIHLQAAGGFQMPAIMILLTCLLAFSCDHNTLNIAAPTTGSRSLRRWLPSLIAAGLAGFVLVAGLNPVYRIQAPLQLGRSAAVEGRAEVAREALLAAAEADPLAAEPRQQLAELETYVLFRQSATEMTVTQLRQQVAEVARFQEFAPRSAAGHRLEATAAAQAYLLSGDPDFLRWAAESWNEAIRRHPTSVEFRVEWCRQLQRMPTGSDEVNTQVRSELRTHANAALELNKINIQWGHADRILDTDTVTSLTAAASDENTTIGEQP